MMLGTKARYAVMAMVELARCEERKPVSLSDLAMRQEIPLPYLEQIFAKLRRNGLVQAVRGPGGGYLLARPCEEIWVSDIILAVEETLKMTRCNGHSAAGCMARSSRCLTHDLWEGLGNHIFAFLRSVSLADICDRKVNEKIMFLMPRQPNEAVRPDAAH